MRRYEVVYTSRAERLIRDLDEGILKLCLEAIRRLAEDPFRGKRLHGELKGVFSYRTGDYRILYEIHRRQLRVLVLALGHRRDVYERIKRWLYPFSRQRRGPKTTDSTDFHGLHRFRNLSGNP